MDGQVRVLDPVDFHGQALVVIDREGEPYVAMKPVVEGMGLTWQPQHRKLADNAARWGIINMVIPSVGGAQGTACLPLRKLPGWLMTINPAKVKPEIAGRVILYQAECDDALWAYWHKGAALNPRVALTPNELLLQAVQALVDQDRKLAAVQSQQEQIAGRVEAIEQRAVATRQGLLALPAPEGPVAELSTRARVNRLVRDFTIGQGLQYGDVWRLLYREFRDRYHVDLVVRAANADVKPLDVAEGLGEAVMGDLYGVAYDLFVARPVHVPRDE
jgi:hypothetical protein